MRTRSDNVLSQRTPSGAGNRRVDTQSRGSGTVSPRARILALTAVDSQPSAK